MRFRYEDDQEIGQAYFLSPSLLSSSHTSSIHLNVITEGLKEGFKSPTLSITKILSKFKIYLFIKSNFL